MFATPSLQITPAILNFIGGIDEFKGVWRARGTLAPDRPSALRRVATIESIASSTRIGGSKLSEREVQRLLSNLQVKLVTWFNAERAAARLHLLLLIGLGVVVLPEFHPFQNGNGRITMGDAIRLTSGNRNALKQHCRRLVEQGHFARRGAGRGVWYELTSTIQTSA